MVERKPVQLRALAHRILSMRKEKNGEEITEQLDKLVLSSASTDEIVTAQHALGDKNAE